MPSGQRVTIIGATGLLGRQVVARLLERSHQVTALVRPTGRTLPIRAPSLTIVAGDIFDLTALREAFAGANTIVHLATAIPPAGPTMDWAPNDRIRREGTRNCLAAARDCGVARCIIQSVAMVYAGGGSAWIDETAPLIEAAATRSAIDMEQQVRHSGMDGTILRGGMFYGPGTDNSRTWESQAKSKTMTTPGNGEDYLSLIHVTDMARAVVAAVEAPHLPDVLNIVDDAPPTWRALTAAIAGAHGQTSALSGPPPRFPSLRVANTLAKSSLNWQPAYPSYLSGLVA